MSLTHGDQRLPNPPRLSVRCPSLRGIARVCHLPGRARWRGAHGEIVGASGWGEGAPREGPGPEDAAGEAPWRLSGTRRRRFLNQLGPSTWEGGSVSPVRAAVAWRWPPWGRAFRGVLCVSHLRAGSGCARPARGALLPIRDENGERSCQSPRASGSSGPPLKQTAGGGTANERHSPPP